MAPASLQDVEVLTFDLYGTIVDMQQGLVEAIAPVLGGSGLHGKPERGRHLVAPDPLPGLDDRRAG